MHKNIIKQLEKNIFKIDNYFPQRIDGNKYWHYHFPLPSTLSFDKLDISTKQQLISLILKYYSLLIKNKPNVSEFLKVIAAISIPNISDSQIIVFFDEEYFKSFFQRDSQQQCWNPLDMDKSLLNELRIPKPERINELGMNEQIIDGENIYNSNIWLYGEVPKELFKNIKIDMGISNIDHLE